MELRSQNEKDFRKKTQIFEIHKEETGEEKKEKVK